MSNTRQAKRPNFRPQSNPKRGRVPNALSETATLEAGATGLWNASMRICMQALAWKLLSELKSNGVGTNEIEIAEVRRN